MVPRPDSLDTVEILVVVGAVLAFAGAMAALGRSRRGAHGRSSGLAGGLLGVEDVFAPSAQEARVERAAQHERRAPAPIPGDGSLSLSQALPRRSVTLRITGPGPR